MTLPWSPTSRHSQEDPHICPQCVLRPSWAPGAGRWLLGPVSPGRGVSRTSQFTLSPHCFQSLPSELSLAPKPDKLVPPDPTALHPRSFRKGEVGHGGRLGKGTLSPSREEMSPRESMASSSKAASLSIFTFCRESHSQQRELHMQRL